MLKEKLMQDLKDAMKEKDTIKKDTVQMVRAAILQIEKDKGIEVDDNNKTFSCDDSGVLFNKDKTELIRIPAGIKDETYSIRRG